jgi:hypothetical protein
VVGDLDHAADRPGHAGVQDEGRPGGGGEGEGRAGGVQRAVILLLVLRLESMKY